MSEWTEADVRWGFLAYSEYCCRLGHEPIWDDLPYQIRDAWICAALVTTAFKESA